MTNDELWRIATVITNIFKLQMSVLIVAFEILQYPFLYIRNHFLITFYHWVNYQEGTITAVEILIGTVWNDYLELWDFFHDPGTIVVTTTCSTYSTISPKNHSSATNNRFITTTTTFKRFPAHPQALFTTTTSIYIFTTVVFLEHLKTKLTRITIPTNAPPIFCSFNYFKLKLSSTSGSTKIKFPLKVPSSFKFLWAALKSPLSPQNPTTAYEHFWAITQTSTLKGHFFPTAKSISQDTIRATTAPHITISSFLRISIKSQFSHTPILQRSSTTPPPLSFFSWILWELHLSKLWELPAQPREVPKNTSSDIIDGIYNVIYSHYIRTICPYIFFWPALTFNIPVSHPSLQTKIVLFLR